MSGADEAHGHGHGGSRFIQHHYDDAQHQFDSGKLGIWLFLAQEVLFFSALFVAYVLYRYHHPEIYGYAHKYLDVKYGAINTGVLIFSSMTAAWAVRAAQRREKSLLILCIFVTILCACAFLGIKFIEYRHKYHEQLLFGKYFDPCVTAANTPLLAKKNTCPGHETSVFFENNNPQTGCYPMIAIDQDPAKEGVQLDCEVHEAELEVKMKPKLAPKKDKDGKEVKGADGKPEMEEVKDEKTGKPVMDQAKDKYGQWIFEEKEVSPVKKQCPPPEPFAKEEGEHEPCWMMSYQPNVCRPAYYYTTTCAPGAPCAATWTRKHGDFLAPEVSNPSLKEDDCELSRFSAAVDLRKENEEAKKAGKPDNGLAISGACVYSEAVGFLVDYGGTAEHEKRAVAVCKPPPAPKAKPDDLFAEEVQKPKLGEKAVVTGEVHEISEHEQLYMGPPPDHTNMFFTIYFAMTGLHGIHVFVGVIVFIWLLIRATKGHFTPDYFGPVDFAALYWHIVDLIWIFLFPLLYLIH